MKTQFQKPVSGKTRYAPEYKEEALAKWRQSGRSAARVAAELGIRAPLLYRWAKQQRMAGQQAGHPLLPKRERLSEMQAVIDRLTEENAKLLEQREVLKKSLGILSETPPRGMPKSKS
jgi:transposase